MNRSELIDRVAEKAETTKAAAARVVEAIFDAASGVIAEAVKAGSHVSIPGFGKFKPKTRAARKGRNPRTGEEIDIPERQVMSFAAAKVMQQTMGGDAGRAGAAAGKGRAKAAAGGGKAAGARAGAARAGTKAVADKVAAKPAGGSTGKAGSKAAGRLSSPATTERAAGGKADGRAAGAAGAEKSGKAKAGAAKAGAAKAGAAKAGAAKGAAKPASGARKTPKSA